MTGGRAEDLGEAAARVDAAFAATDRRGYLPEAVRDRAGVDAPLALTHGMTNSQPSTVRDMLLALAVPAGARVLDVGSGSGWTTALLAHLVGPTGAVLGVEIVPALVTFGAGNLAAAQRPWARIEPAAPDVLGRPDVAPYDRILVSAMAQTLPEPLVDQLADGGVLVVPVDGRMLRVSRTTSGATHVVRFGHYRFVPLR